MKKILVILLIHLFILVTAFFVVTSYTPKPFFYVIQFIHKQPKPVKPKNEKEISKNIKIQKDIIYSNKFKNSTMDLYFPKNKKKVPVIIFIHGGGFFLGDKNMANYFGKAMSNDKYAYISINYNLVPEATIFEQLEQINEAIKFIKEYSDEYSLDSTKINLSGSSAGGFLAMQLLSVYHNEKYARNLGITPVEDIEFNSILLYSTIFNLSHFQQYNKNIIHNYFVNEIGWGITGDKYWRESDEIGDVLNLTQYISENFPPVFITDGNINTFTEQALMYSSELRKKNVKVETLFFDESIKVGHGYQLKMNTDVSKQSVQKSLNFLNDVN